MNDIQVNELLEKVSNNEHETNLPVAVLVNDQEGNIIICNSFFALTLGRPLEEILGTNINDLVKKEMYNKTTALRALKLKQVVTDIVTTLKGIRVQSTSTPIQDSNGEISLVVTYSYFLNYEDYSALEKKRLDKIEQDEYNLLKEQIIYDEHIVAESLPMKRILQICNQVAQYDSKILLYGESGTGKDVLANYIHEISNRKDAKFISVNCAAIPEALFESELFGHEKGSFTGATLAKQGLLELANGGTLFLDEISEMPLGLQAKLLRVLEAQEFRRLGGTDMHTSNFRLISATNKDLKQLVEEGKFRRDLYYRISVIPINIPPLRERELDIIALTNKFINQFNERYGLKYKIDSEQFRFILSYKWPGNVRELKNYVEKLVVINKCSDTKRINNSSNLENYCVIPYDQETTLKDFLAEAEKQFIKNILEDCNGKVCEASNKLGIHRTALYRKLKMEDSQKKAEIN